MHISFICIILYIFYCIIFLPLQPRTSLDTSVSALVRPCINPDLNNAVDNRASVCCVTIWGLVQEEPVWSTGGP